MDSRGLWWLAGGAGGGGGGLPPIPSRDQLCQAPFIFQGLGPVPTQQFGTLSYLFDIALGWLGADDRQAIYRLKREAGSKVIAVAISGQFFDPDQDYLRVPGRDFSKDWNGLQALISEAVIQEGFYVRLFQAGDGQSMPDFSYNDPEGWTYGWQWLMNQLPKIVDVVRPLYRFIQFFPGFDGIIGYNEQQFGPWSIANLCQYLIALRQLLPDCVSGVETAEGPLGGRLGEFLLRQDLGGSDAAYDAIDIISNEFPAAGSAQAPWGDIHWQIADRALGPAFVRPPEMPASDDPRPPWSLARLTSRGRIWPEAMEYALYEQAHNALPSPIPSQRAYYRAMGYPLVA